MFINNLQNAIWFVGVALWMFGLGDRTLAASADHALTAIDLMQLFTAAFTFVCWLFLKPGLAEN